MAPECPADITVTVRTETGRARMHLAGLQLYDRMQQKRVQHRIHKRRHASAPRKPFSALHDKARADLRAHPRKRLKDGRGGRAAIGQTRGIQRQKTRAARQAVGIHNRHVVKRFRRFPRVVDALRNAVRNGDVDDVLRTRKLRAEETLVLFHRRRDASDIRFAVCQIPRDALRVDFRIVAEHPALRPHKEVDDADVVTVRQKLRQIAARFHRDAHALLFVQLRKHALGFRLHHGGAGRVNQILRQCL